jgi:hypothetical protein
MSVFMLCERALGLVRGNRLDLSAAETRLLENLDYTDLLKANVQEEAVCLGGRNGGYWVVDCQGDGEVRIRGRATALPYIFLFSFCCKDVASGIKKGLRKIS